MTTQSSWEDWKVEPDSPGFTSPEHEADFWSCDSDVILSSPKEEKDEPIESKSAAQLLDELDEWIKEEPFADWLEERIDVPFLNDIPEPLHEPRGYIPSVQGDYNVVKTHPALEVKVSQQSPQYVVPDGTQSLINEFESVFGEVEHNLTLTPPQSPIHHSLPVQTTTYASVQYPGIFPQNSNANPFLVTMQQLIPVHTVPDSTYHVASVSPITTVTSVLTPISATYAGKKESLIPNFEQIVPSPEPIVPSSHPDLDEELDYVDELIRTHVEDLEPVLQQPVLQQSESHNQHPEIDVNSPSSFQESARNTLEVIPPSPSATSNSSFDSVEDISDDPDWSPSNIDASSSGCEKVTGSRKRASKPYARIGTEEKRLRKKEQNKNAATRYRMKKKAEVEEILSEEKQLADTNEELQSKVNDLSREIKYLKGLMRDVFKAKGLLK